MRIKKKEFEDRKSKIYVLFYYKKLKKGDIAKKMGVHRNTIRNYLI